MPALIDAGANVAAISPQTIEENAKSRRKHSLSYPVLRDAGNEVAAAYGLRHRYADDLLGVYESFGIVLPRSNGEDSQTLPVPARLIIDPSGVIRDIDADPDYTKRPEPEQTLQKLKSLRA